MKAKPDEATKKKSLEGYMNKTAQPKRGKAAEQAVTAVAAGSPTPPGRPGRSPGRHPRATR